MPISQKVLLLCATLIVGLFPGVTKGQEMMAVGYYPSYRHGVYPHTAVKFDGLTHLAHSFIWPAKDGSGELDVPAGFVYPELIEAAHLANVRVVLALGGFDNTEGFGPAASDPAKRALLVGEIVAFVQENGYDGVDLDWEGFSDATYREALSLLIEDLDAALEDADPDLTLSMPVGATNWHGAYDMPRVVEHLDWVGVMTYDLHGSWIPHAGHHTPLYPSAGDEDDFSLSQSVTYWLDRGIPKEKMLPGMAFYGRRWEGATAPMDSATGGDAITYASLHELLDDEAWVRHWDEDAHAPYLVNEADQIFISYEDEESILDKVGYIRNEELGGAIIWEISQDYLPSGEQPLLAAASELTFPVAVEEEVIAGNAVLLANHPNPFSSSTTISFELPRPTGVIIDVYDLLGRRLTTLADGLFSAGRHEVRWEAGGQAGGLYVYRMRAGDRIQSGTMLLVR